MFSMQQIRRSPATRADFFEKSNLLMPPTAQNFGVRLVPKNLAGLVPITLSPMFGTTASNVLPQSHV